MASSRVHVTINTSALNELTMPGVGMVSRKIHRISEEIATLARVYSPKRSGDMVRSIDTQPGTFNGSKCSYEVHIGVSYASFVLRGTVGPIHAGFRRSALGQFTGHGTDKRGRRTGSRRMLAVGKSQGGPITYRKTVSGQAPNDFLGRAANEVLNRYGL